MDYYDSVDVTATNEPCDGVVNLNERTMHKLGDQWVEIGKDGKNHMYKAVESVSEKSYDCTGCCFNGHNGPCMYHSPDCPLAEVEHGYIKDLGILNEDGCLPDCWGEYPKMEVSRDVSTKEYWYRCITRVGVYCTTDSHKTEQEAIDEWNRRG